MSQYGLIYAGGIAAISLAARLWVSYRRDVRVKREYKLPLFDAVLLEVALTPQKGEAEDADVLAEMRETLAHLNRRSFAKEFWGLDEQLAQYYEKLPEKCQPTMRRALLRLIDQPDRWLQSIAAKTCGRLGIMEAAGPIRALLEKESESASPVNAADAHFHTELEAALKRLETWPPTAEEL
jgi:hypothetical protein